MKFFVILFFSFNIISFSQVGIGTVNPTSKLEISTTDDGIPGLELNPQSSPVGSADGQISVIDDLLYMYDDNRSKWLSVLSTSFQFGRAGDVDNTRLRFGGTVANNNSGTLLPLNGTIIGFTVNTSGGLANKGFQIRIRNGFVNQSVIDFNLTNNKYNSFLINQDFNKDDYLVVNVQNQGSSVSNPVVVIWVKWRK